MTREDAKKLLPIIRAYSEGKAIETRQRRDSVGAWVEMDTLSFSMAPECYRIKPDPVERWGLMDADGKFLTTFVHEDTAKAYVDNHGGRYFLMREVV